MADNVGGKDGATQLPDKSTNQHVSAAARLASAAPGGEKQAETAKDEAEAAQKLSDAAQKAAPTGKDLPEIAAENIKGHQTAISKPHQPKDQDSLKATGAQLEPALIAKDGGSIPHAMVSSPTGMVPAAAAGGAQALAQYEARLKKELAAEELSEEKLLTMNKHEIRAVASDRGYKVGEGSVRALTRRFLEAQGTATSEARGRAEAKSQADRKADAVKPAGEDKK